METFLTVIKSLKKKRQSHIIILAELYLNSEYSGNIEIEKFGRTAVSGGSPHLQT